LKRRRIKSSRGKRRESDKVEELGGRCRRRRKQMGEKVERKATREILGKE
jgi:hypothetical protein